MLRPHIHRLAVPISVVVGRVQAVTVEGHGLTARTSNLPRGTAGAAASDDGNENPENGNRPQHALSSMSCGMSWSRYLSSSSLWSQDERSDPASRRSLAPQASIYPRSE